MTINQVIGPVALFFLLGATATVYAQHEEGKPEKPEAKAEPQRRAQPAKEQAQQPKREAPPAKPQAEPKQPQQPQAQRTPAPKAPAQPEAQQPKREPSPARQQAEPKQPQQQQAQRTPTPKAPAQPKAQQPEQKAQQQQHAQSPATHRQTAQAGKASAQKSSYAPPQRTRQQAQTWQQQNGWRQDGAWQEHASWQQDRSSNWQSDHRTWAQRGGYGGYYIPQASFGLYFGIGHWFRIQSEPVIFGGYPRFQYGGYSFLIVDPWPGDWAQNWYAADDVYVGFDNGYYLYNRQFPGEAIAITVVL